MTARQKLTYERELAALCERQISERKEMSVAQAKERADLEAIHYAGRKELEEKQQREWFELRARLGKPIGPAGQHILGKQIPCTHHTK